MMEEETLPNESCSCPKCGHTFVAKTLTREEAIRKSLPLMLCEVEASVYLNLSEKKIRYLRKNGHINFLKIPGIVAPRYTIENLQEFLERHKTKYKF